MIEAIPVSPEAIILLITKVEYPEELDTRFSKFSDMSDALEEYADSENGDAFAQGADDILGLFRKISEETKSADSTEFIPLKDTLTPVNTEKKVPKEKASVPVDLTKLFVFHNLADITRLSRILQGFYKSDNTLYTENGSHTYYLVVHKGSHSPEVFNKVCNILAEYARQATFSSASEAYFKEHYTVLCRHNALQTFASFS
jgi:adapter protein MecA 1/2